MSRPTDLAEQARAVIDAIWYLTLGTTEPDGRPRLSPVYFTHVGYRDFYWVSSPDAHHSRNLAERPDIAIVVYDSTAPVGQGRAVYLSGSAAQVGDDELAQRCAEAFTDLRGGARPFAPEELSGDADLRLYRARVTSCEVHIRGGDPEYGTGVDTRRAVRIDPA
ncbi:MAG: pyridoxamine 5'-phosphate oxidase family protein [Hamadaea sp.]|nr:pyridoxamine 5'-phosphate oxidase family protein [Hamadaea sp.]